MFDTYVTPVWNYIRDASVTVQCVVGAMSLYAFYRMVLKKKYRLPPGPRGLPLLGNLTAFREDFVLDKINEWQKKYGPILTMYFGPSCTIVINDIDLMTEAIVTRGSDFSGRPYFYSLDKLTQGSKDIAFAPYGDTWKYQKKVAVQSLRQYLTGHQLEERVHNVLQPSIQDMESNTGPFVLRTTLSLMVFNVLHSLCFGSMKGVDDPAFKRIMYVVDFQAEGGNGFLEDIFPPLRLWPTQRFKEFAEGYKWVSDYTYQQILDHRTDFNDDSLRCLTDSVILAQKELIETDSAATKHMTDEHATQLVLDVFGAGVDTTRTTLEWIFLVMIANPDIQTRMQREIDEVVGEKIPGKEHRAKLVYTEAVMLETMRLYAVAPLSVPHETMCDTSVGGYEIPAKTVVLFNQHFILRDPKHWEDPLKFKPERFMSEDGTKIVLRNRSFIPFSAGHRACPGESLAKLDILYIVVGLLQKFTFSLPAGEKADLTPNIDYFGFRTPVYNVVVRSR